MSSEKRIQWYRTSLPKDQLKNLTEKRDIPALIHVVSQLGFSTATGIGTYLCWIYLSWPFFILALYVHCMFFAFLNSAAVHELSHRSPFKTRWLNEFFIVICSFVTWNNYVKYRCSHRGHHQLTVHKGLDYEVILPTIIKPWHWIFLWTAIPFKVGDALGPLGTIAETFRHARGQLKGHWEHFILPESDQKNRKKVIFWNRCLLTGHGILIAFFLYFGLWPLLLIVNFAVFIAPGLAAITGLHQHAGLVHNVPDFRLCCRTVLLNPILRFFYWNMNYHVEHHMYAAVPFYNLPLLRKAIEHDLPKANRGLLSVWREVKPVMKQNIVDPDYCIVPQVPNPKMV